MVRCGGKHPVVVLSGDEGRKLFFSDKSLNFIEGYRLLMGGVSLRTYPFRKIVLEYCAIGAAFGRHRHRPRTY
jgi:hypothetical protein